MPRLSPEKRARELLRRLARAQGISDVTTVRAGLHLPQLLEMLDLAYQEVPRITDSSGREFVGELDWANRDRISDVTTVRAGLHLPQLLEMLDLAYQEVPRITDSSGREFVGELDWAN